MASIIRMPEVLAGASEAVLSNWLVTEGAADRGGRRARRN